MVARRSNYGLRDAVRWIAGNDDQDLGSEEEGGFIMTIMFAADIYGKTPEEIAAMVRRVREKEGW